VIRSARAEDAEALSALALRSKAHWGYDASFLAAAAPDLAVTAGDIGALVVRVAEGEGAPLGFSALDLRGDEPELVALFVEPSAIGTGLGRTLLDDARAAVRAAGFTTMLIESDPYAEPFYRSQGADRVGTRTAASTGRALPLLRLEA